jgi:hypothetical protein
VIVNGQLDSAPSPTNTGVSLTGHCQATVEHAQVDGCTVGMNIALNDGTPATIDSSDFGDHGGNGTGLQVASGAVTVTSSQFDQSSSYGISTTSNLATEPLSLSLQSVRAAGNHSAGVDLAAALSVTPANVPTWAIDEVDLAGNGVGVDPNLSASPAGGIIFAGPAILGQMTRVTAHGNGGGQIYIASGALPASGNATAYWDFSANSTLANANQVGCYTGSGGTAYGLWVAANNPLAYVVDAQYVGFDNAPPNTTNATRDYHEAVLGAVELGSNFQVDAGMCTP